MTEHQTPAVEQDDRQERRARVLARLGRLGPGPAGWFADACRFADHDLQLVGQSNYLFHAVRELESSVREILVSQEDRKAAKKDKNTQRFEVASILATYGVASTSDAGQTWMSIVGQLHSRAHRTNLQAPTALEPAARQLFHDIEAMLDVVLDAVDAGYLTILERIERLAALPQPGTADAARLLKEFPQNRLTWWTFFSNCASAAWLQPLRTAGIFNTPPTSQNSDDTQDIRWPATAYLARVANQAPALVLEITRDTIPATDNPFVNLDVVDIALTLPPDIARDLAPRITTALTDTSDLLDPTRYAALAVRLAEHGQPDPAEDLIKALLQAVGITARDEWALRQLLTDAGPHLTRSLGLRWATTLAERLDHALAAHGAPSASGFDLSQNFFPSLEHPTSQPFRMREAYLAEALRDATRQLLADGTDIDDVLAVLSAYPWWIFQRLRLHLLEHHGDLAPHLVEQALTDRLLRQHTGVELEWRRLAHARAGQLPASIREQLIADLAVGPDTDAWRATFHEHYDADIADAALEQATGQWRRDRLAAVQDHLPELHLAQLHSLEAKFGPTPSLDDIPSGFITRPQEPGTTTDDLAALSSAELIDAVKTFKPDPRAFHGDGTYAFSANIRTTISSRAPVHCADAARFAELDDPYLLAVLAGFTDAARAGTALDWEPLIALAQATVTRTSEEAADIQYRAALLLTTGLATARAPLPALAEQIWTAAGALLRADVPNPPGVARPGLRDRDPRAQALRTMVAWARWRRGHGADHHRLFALLDALTTTEPLTGPDAETVVSVVVGQRFVQLADLDAQWAEAHVHLLGHPQDAEAPGWEAYMQSADRDPAAARMLLEHYRTAASTPAGDSDPQTTQQRQQLGRHLFHLYWNDLATLDDGGLLDSFYRTTSDGILCQLSWDIVASLHDDNPVGDELLDKVRAWWTWRSAALLARAGDLTDTERIEIQHAGPLAATRRFPVQWALQQIHDALAATGSAGTDSRVFRYLAEAAAQPGYTRQVLDILGRWLTSSALDPWLPSARESEIRTALEHGTTHHPEKVREIVNRLASRGNPQFRSVLLPDDNNNS